MVKTLAAFAKELRRIAPSGSLPFVCDGSPGETVSEARAIERRGFWE